MLKYEIQTFVLVILMTIVTNLQEGKKKTISDIVINIIEIHYLNISDTF